MGLKKDLLAPSLKNLYGFTDHSIKPRGIISFPLTLGENPMTKTINNEWVVVLGKSSFNVIIGNFASTRIHHIDGISQNEIPTDQGVREVPDT